MWLDRAVKWLLPREEHFFDLLEKGAERAYASSELLVQCCEAKSAKAREPLIGKMSDEEHAADRVIHEVYEALNKTFVTPLDRSDIYSLATALENITDRVDETVSQLNVHAITDLPQGSLEIAEKVKLACAEIQGAVKLLRGLKKLDTIRNHCAAINALEREGDQVFRASIADMYANEKDAIALLKHKEFLEALELTLDTCDDVGNALESLVIKNA